MLSLCFQVRKTIPIPKAYYWETGNNDLSARTKAWHQVVGALGAVVRFTDRIGQPVVNATGLADSRFDYVTSNMTDEQWERARKSALERKLLNQAKKASTQAEEGMGATAPANP